MNIVDEIIEGQKRIEAKLDQLITERQAGAERTVQQQLLDTLPDQLRSRDIKKVFGISGVSLWKWSKKGLLTPQLINGRNYFAKNDVLKLLGQKKVGSRTC